MMSHHNRPSSLKRVQVLTIIAGAEYHHSVSSANFSIFLKCHIYSNAFSVDKKTRKIAKMPWSFEFYFRTYGFTFTTSATTYGKTSKRFYF